MHVINPIGRVISTEEDANYMDKPLAGCKCSSGYEETEAGHGLFQCSCQCDGGTTNYNYNYQDAHDAWGW